MWALGGWPLTAALTSLPSKMESAAFGQCLRESYLCQKRAPLSSKAREAHIHTAKVVQVKMGGGCDRPTTLYVRTAEV